MVRHHFAVRQIAGVGIIFLLIDQGCPKADADDAFPFCNGLDAFERTIAAIPDHIPVILDCKTGDIGHTQAAWGRGLYETWGVDAITVNPYVGAEAALPLMVAQSRDLVKTKVC